MLFAFGSFGVGDIGSCARCKAFSVMAGGLHVVGVSALNYDFVH
jgi:hypothetical protein